MADQVVESGEEQVTEEQMDNERKSDAEAEDEVEDEEDIYDALLFKAIRSASSPNLSPQVSKLMIPNQSSSSGTSKGM